MSSVKTCIVETEVQVWPELHRNRERTLLQLSSFDLGSGPLVLTLQSPFDVFSLGYEPSYQQLSPLSSPGFFPLMCPLSFIVYLYWSDFNKNGH